MTAPSSRLTSKAGVVLLALVGAGLLLVSGSQTWVSGTVDDAVLGSSRVTGSGSDVASGVVALALAGAAAAIAATTSGRVVRRVVIVVLALAALGSGVLVARVVADPSGVLGAVAARSTGRTGSIETHATVTPWPFIAATGALLLLCTAVAAWLGSRRWRGLSARYDAPAAPAAPGRDGPTSRGTDARGSRGERVASDWERLSAGEDPTTTEPPRGKTGPDQT